MRRDGYVGPGKREKPGRPIYWPKTQTNIYKNPSWRWRNIKDPPVPLHYEVPMAFHHVIPWETIWQCWNSLLFFERWGVLAHWVYMINVKLDDVVLLKEARYDKKGDPILMRLCWPLWNTVEGPEHRDEGKQALNQFDGFYSGKDENVKTRMDLLRNLCKVMKEYTETTDKMVAKSDEGWAKHEEEQAVRLRIELANVREQLKDVKMFVTFDEDMWIRVDKIDSSLLLNGTAHAKWRKKV